MISKIIEMYSVPRACRIDHYFFAVWLEHIVHIDPDLEGRDNESLCFPETSRLIPNSGEKARRNSRGLTLP